MARGNRHLPETAPGIPMYILGISAYYHDSAACIVRDGWILAAAQEERFSRKKHDHRFPHLAVEYCLRESGITPSQLSAVAFYDKPWLKFERLLETYLAFAPSGIASFLMAMPLWLKEKLWMGELVQHEVGFDGQLFYPEHHQSHAASAFYPSPYERAAILTIDGVGDLVVGCSPRQSHRFAVRNAVPPQPRPAVQRVHLLHRVQGELW